MNENMECPICGKKFDANDCCFLSNGNPVCPDCAKKEKDNDDSSENKTNKK